MSGKVKSDHTMTKSGYFKCGQVMSVLVRSGQVKIRSRQIKLGQDKVMSGQSQVNSDKVSSDQVKFRS